MPSSDFNHLFAAHCRLGESPIWVPEHDTLFWADIRMARIHSLELGTMLHRIVNLDLTVTAIARRGDDRWIAASTTGLYDYDWGFTEKTFLMDPCSAIEGVRLNDAVVDRAGRLWVGSLNQNHLQAPDGALYRLDPDLSLHQLDGGFSVANGITSSPAGDRLYVSNMFKGEVFVYELDAAGNLSDKRVFTRIPESEGLPDGLTVDTLGYLWIGHWKGGRVTRHDPNTGDVVLELRTPVTNVSRCTFGGKDLDQLFVNTAWHGVESELANQPLAGDIFSVKTSFKGMPEEKFRG